MADHTDNYAVGFKRPPKHTRFVKGQSGNVRGRPKGSQNLATILDKVGREPVFVTENGKRRRITKKEAALLQLANKSASGDLTAIRQYTNLAVMCEAFTQGPDFPGSDERDRSAMANMLKRIRQTDLNVTADPATGTSDPKEEK